MSFTPFPIAFFISAILCLIASKSILIRVGRSNFYLISIFFPSILVFEQHLYLRAPQDGSSPKAYSLKSEGLPTLRL